MDRSILLLYEEKDDAVDVAPDPVLAVLIADGAEEVVENDVDVHHDCGCC